MRSRHRFVRIAVLTMGTVALLAAPALAASPTVSITDNLYTPHVLTITKGETVVWTDKGNNPHSVTANAGQSVTFDSSPSCNAAYNTGGCLKKGQTFQFTFTRAGTFTYYCRVHGTPGSTTCPMCGTIVVKEAATPKPTARPSPKPAPRRAAVVPAKTTAPRASPTPRPSPSATPSPAISPSPSPLAAPPVRKASNRGLVVGLAIAGVALAASAGALAFFRLRTRP